MDIEKAYRNIPILPRDKKYVVCVHNGKFWLDHTNPFGLCTVHGLLGMVTDFLRRIWMLCFVYTVLKWVDDILLFRTPNARLPPSGDGKPRFQYQYDLTFLLSLFAGARLPMAPDEARRLLRHLRVPWLYLVYLDARGAVAGA